MSTVIQNQHPFVKPRWLQIWIPVAVSILLVILGCGSRSKGHQDTIPTPTPKHLPPMGYTIQVGAFASINNAVRFTEKLQTQARRSIEHEFDQAKQQLQAEILEKSLAKAEEIIKEKISADDQDRLVDEYLNKVVA